MAAAALARWIRGGLEPAHGALNVPIPLGGGVGVWEEVAGAKSQEGESVCGHARGKEEAPPAVARWRWSGVAPPVGYCGEEEE